MSRQSAATDVAFNGIVGTIPLFVGSISASVLVAMFSPWLAAIPALLVWGVVAFYGFQQFAYGFHTIVEDATKR
ncbi:hypothetical protein ACFFQF_25800 [Haladaptatus pallidirubidus]|nr:hypothetical protein [Haladaptatus pallidirubidus]